jgi:hypothetical protein
MKMLKKLLKKIKIMKIIHIGGNKSQIIHDKVEDYYETLKDTEKFKKTITITYVNKLKHYKVGELYSIHVSHSNMDLVIECLNIATIDINLNDNLEYIVEFMVLFANDHCLLNFKVGNQDTFWKTSPMDNGSKHLKEK